MFLPKIGRVMIPLKMNDRVLGLPWVSLPFARMMWGMTLSVAYLVGALLWRFVGDSPLMNFLDLYLMTYYTSVFFVSHYNYRQLL